MKLKKLFKIVIMISTTAIPLTSASVILSSCGHNSGSKKPNKKFSFADFTKAAKAESSINIVNNASPGAKGWHNLVDNDLTKSNFTMTDNTISVTITSNSLQEDAIFTATYTKDQEYKVNNWACTRDSHPLTTFTAFVKAAEKESAINIIKYARTKAEGWDNLVASDLTKGIPTNNDNSVIMNISSKSLNQTATFTALYSKNTAYSTQDWYCSTQPSKTFTFSQFKIAVENISDGLPHPALTFETIKKSTMAGVNINFKSFYKIDLKLDLKNSKFSDDGKKNITFKMVFLQGDTITYDTSTTITLKIDFNNTVYDASKWTAPDYTFSDFKTAADHSTAGSGWKNYAIKSINQKFPTTKAWNLKDCTFEPLESDTANNILTIRVVNHADKNNPLFVMASITFKKNSHNQVFVYGENGANGESNSWKFSTEAAYPWAKFQDQASAWASNDANTTIKMIDLLNHFKNAKNFPPAWKVILDSDDTGGEYIFSATLINKPDDIHHILNYVISANLATSPNTYKLNVTLTQTGNNDLSMSNFVISSNQPAPIPYHWDNEIEKILTKSNSDPTVNIMLVRSIYNYYLATVNNNSVLPKLAALFQNTDYNLLGCSVDEKSYSYNATGGHAHGGFDPLHFGEVSYQLTFYKVSDTSKKAITSGGLFYIDRVFDTSIVPVKPINISSYFISFGGIITDIN